MGPVTRAGGWSPGNTGDQVSDTRRVLKTLPLPSGGGRIAERAREFADSRNVWRFRKKGAVCGAIAPRRQAEFRVAMAL